ncbi:MAG: TonB-dependent receptor plug [Cytophagaceae bacterium]|jgi:outer membrane receptor for ferrienterochelin and colicins|nr:TonB-dependent receptor plug [Cytophagaceae bacterium]
MTEKNPVLLTVLSAFLLLWSVSLAPAQSALKGYISSNNQPIIQATIVLEGTSFGTATDEEGRYSLSNIQEGKYKLTIASIGYVTLHKTVVLEPNTVHTFDFVLAEESFHNEVVVTGSLEEVSRLKSPVPVEIYTPAYFKKNPTPSVFESLQLVNGVRPQSNCNICNTGDIHINGLEGPYTMITIDGMPIVSGLSTVYGLNGIPNSLIERMEVVKGPASTLYGSEAVGGLINVITKNADNAPKLSLDLFSTSWGEVNSDVGATWKGKKTAALIGINHFNYSFPMDKNGDGFTDLTLSKRTSVFNKWQLKRPYNRSASIAARYVYEDRWGGQTNWDKQFRGTDSVYGESIYTNRIELMGNYQLPVSEKIIFSFSGSIHDQDSYYGTTPYLANQKIGFGQLVWYKDLGLRHKLLTGAALRYTWYDDNTPATQSANSLLPENKPSKIVLPGFFIQDEFRWNEKSTLLGGLRYDYNSIHGSILTPRLNYMYKPNATNTFRLSMGTGYRVANVFTEDHAALTGARDVVFTEELKPEKSVNANLNYQTFIPIKSTLIGIDASLFYTHFSNKIIPDYSDPNKIIYQNLKGYSVSRGFTFNLDIMPASRFKLRAGATIMDVYRMEEDAEGALTRKEQLLTEKYTGTWVVSYAVIKDKLTLDYTGNLYGPMKLPLLSASDPRAEYSPWFSIQNIQVTYKIKKQFEVYGGVKNLLNYTPPKNSIARAHDPFDKKVIFDSNGNATATPENPYALTFDPTYVYTSNQGIRLFLGLRYTLP